MVSSRVAMKRKKPSFKKVDPVEAEAETGPSGGEADHDFMVQLEDDDDSSDEDYESQENDVDNADEWEESSEGEDDSSEEEEDDEEGDDDDETVSEESGQGSGDDDEVDETTESAPPKPEKGSEETKNPPAVVSHSTTDGPSRASTVKPEKGGNDEYEYDSSDEEDIRNTIGNIPINWYDDLPHIGYDWDGKKIIKPNQGDQIDYFLKKMEDPNFWRTVRNPETGQDVVLSDKHIDTIRRLESSKIPDSEFDAYAPWVEWFSSEVMKMPLRKFPEHKRSFLPSKDEMRKVSKYVHALKMGWMKTRKQMKKEQREKKLEGPKFYMLWKNDDTAEEMRRIQSHIPAPKRPLPDHSESYNPPEEYLFSEKEMKKWNKDRKSLGNKKLHFVPQKYKSLREVPAYRRYIRERFLRCLDLYMCPRAVKMKLTIEPEDLVPQLPSPKDLQPFPTTKAVVYLGHTDMVRSISVEPTGQYLASTSDDLTVKIWEVNTGRCVHTLKTEGVGRCVAWNPNNSLGLVAVASDRNLLIYNPGVGDIQVVHKIDNLLKEPPEEDKLTPERVKTVVRWEEPDDDQWASGIRIILPHFKEIKQVVWHAKGDYFASVMPEGENRSVVVHQLSKRKSQLPFSRPRGLVQAVLFHPYKPLFFVATQRHIRIYDLVKLEMSKKLYSNSKWISTMSVHPGGDNLLVGTYDRKVLWFDLDLSTRPYKSIALHGGAVRGVAYHRKYPLFASTSDDNSLIVSHGMVYSDLLQNALIVPLKRFADHKQVNDFSVFDVIFHPTQPWVFTSGADGQIILYS